MVELPCAQIAAHFPRKFSAEGIYCLGDVNKASGYMLFVNDHHFWNRQFNPETMYSSIISNPIYVFIRKLLKRTEPIWLQGET